MNQFEPHGIQVHHTVILPESWLIKGCFDTQWTNRSSCPPKNEAFFPQIAQKFTILQFFSIKYFLNLSKRRGVNKTNADRTMTAQSEKSIICNKPRLTALYAGIVLTPPLMGAWLWFMGGPPHWSQEYGCLLGVHGISKISIFKSIYLENHVSHNELWSNFCLKKWEELIYYGNREI
jgi:hypothetical protein